VILPGIIQIYTEEFVYETGYSRGFPLKRTIDAILGRLSFGLCGHGDSFFGTFDFRYNTVKEY